LKICQAGDGSERPTGFKTSPENGWTLMVFQRDNRVDHQAAATRKAELQKLEGRWELTEENGRPVPARRRPWPTPERVTRYIFKKNKLVYEESSELAAEHDPVIVIEPSTDPKRPGTGKCDEINKGMYFGFTLPGIYALEGDTLKMVFSRIPEGYDLENGEPLSRPTNLKAPAASHSVMIFKRNKP
jgi:uncharacterized protein (TIGR03067 family)